MSRHKVVLTDQVFPSTDVERAILSAIDAELVIPARERLLDEATTADALLNTYLPLDAVQLAQLRSCKVIARYGIGVDNIDLDAARRHGIVVTNVPDYCVEEVSTHTLMLILAAVRRLPAAMSSGLAGEWTIDHVRPIARLSSLTVGVIGLGRIGRRVAELLIPMGPRILGYDPEVETSIDGIGRVRRLVDLLAASDVITLHLPLNSETRGLIDREALASFKEGAILVNTSRGGLVSTADLIQSLRSGHIGASALDVLEREADDARSFEGLSNVIITPHMAYYSEDSVAEAQRKAASQVLKVLTGQMPDYRVA